MSEWARRMAARKDKLEWLYMELYDDRAKLAEFKSMTREMAEARDAELPTGHAGGRICRPDRGRGDAHERRARGVPVCGGEEEKQ